MTTRVVGAEEDPRRHLEPRPRVAPERHRAADRGAGRSGSTGPWPGRARARGTGRGTSRSSASPKAAEPRPAEAPLAALGAEARRDAGAERRGEHRLVPEAPGPGESLRTAAREGRGDVETEVAIEPLGLAQAGQKADVAAPVVADQRRPLDLERVEQCEQVVGQRLLLVARARRIGPAEPAQVGADHAPALGQRPDQLAPHRTSAAASRAEHDGGAPRSPASATWMRIPLASRKRCSTGRRGVSRAPSARK